MTRAQRAMALAMIAPEPEEESAKGGRGKTAKIFAVFGDEERSAMKRAINKARVVLKYKPDLAQEVLSGMLQLDPAYKKAEKSIAYQLQARGLMHRQIAGKLGVTHQTVGNWLANFGTAPELANEPELPDAATLDAIAQAIKDEAKGGTMIEHATEVRLCAEREAGLRLQQMAANGERQNRKDNLKQNTPKSQPATSVSHEKAEIKSAQMFCEIQIGQLLGPNPGQSHAKDGTFTSAHAPGYIMARKSRYQRSASKTSAATSAGATR